MQTSSALGPLSALLTPTGLSSLVLSHFGSLCSTNGQPKGPRITPDSSVVKIHPEPSPIPGTLPHPTHLLPLQPCSL